MNSSGICNICGEKIDALWEVSNIETCERNMGEESTYYCEAEIVCPRCNNRLRVDMRFVEYPPGTLEIEPTITAENNTISLNVPEVSFDDY